MSYVTEYRGKHRCQVVCGDIIAMEGKMESGGTTTTSLTHRLMETDI